MTEPAKPEPADPAEMLETLSPPGPATRRRLATLKVLWPFVRPYRRQVILAFLLLCLASVVMMLMPLGVRQMIDLGFVGGADVDRYFLGLFGIALLWGLAVAARFYQVTWIGERIIADLRDAIYRRMLMQSPQFFEYTRTGEVLSRLTTDTTLVQAVVSTSVSMGLRGSFQVLAGLVMLALTSAKLFVATVVLLVLVMLPGLAASRGVRRLSRESQDRIADTSAVAGEILNAMSTVQAFTKEADEGKRFTAAVESSFRSAIRRTILRAAVTGSAIGGVFGAVVFVLWLGAQAVIEGSMSAGTLASFILYALLVAGGIGVVAEVWGEVMRAVGATERLMELLAAEPAIRAPANPQVLPPSRQARIAFENVRFHYPSRPKSAALDNITLEVREGETVALVGPSGAGKTTMFQLLLRFYEVGSGVIRFNGIDLRQLDPAALRTQIGIVPQDAVIFSADALENIRYGRASATDEEVMAAARAAQADEFIQRLPQGYKTFLGERGLRLSGGQRQRIAIARAMLRNPPLLLLDEATSALDAESEALVQQGLEAAMRDRTTLIIAHRLATVRKADRIIVLEHGRIVETGTPQQLLQQGGLYARLANLQLVA